MRPGAGSTPPPGSAASTPARRLETDWGFVIDIMIPAWQSLFDCIKYLEDSNKLLADICRELPQPTPVIWVPVKTCSFVNSFVNRFLSFLPTYYLWYDPLEVIDWSGMWVGHHYQDQETLQPTLEGGEPPETEGGDWILFLLTFRRLMIFSYTSQLRATLCIPLHEIGMKIHFFFFINLY